ncbi:unnamed protein product [Caenorhabditis nigoni]
MILLRRLLATSSTREIPKRSIFFSRVPESELVYHNADTTTSQDSPSKPVILMIGWAGAASKHLKKYTNIYTDKGFNVISICPPLFHFKVPDDSIGKKILPVMDSIQDKPVVIHSFSMNGIRGLISLAKASNNPKLFEKLEGIVFDSAPSRTLPYQNGKAMMLSRPSVNYMSDSNRAVIFQLVNTIRDALTSPIIKVFPSLRHNFLLYWYIHDKIQLPKRQLFLYSEKDSMIPFRGLEEFIEEQKKRGCHVDSVNFGDTEHVAHFREKPEEYTKKCIEFVSKL